MRSSILVEITSISFHQFPQVSGCTSTYFASLLCKPQALCSRSLQEDLHIRAFLILYLLSEEMVENNLTLCSESNVLKLLAEPQKLNMP